MKTTSSLETDLLFRKKIMWNLNEKVLLNVSRIEKSVHDTYRILKGH